MTPAARIDVDALKAAISLEDLIRVCGVELKRQGSEYRALCPFHNEKTPSFTVTPKTQLYYCLGCGSGGDHIQFLRDRDGLGFKDAAHKLAELSGGRIKTANDNTPKRASNKAPEPAPTWVRGTAPDNAPACPTSLRILRAGEWTDTPVVAAWPYRNRAGELLGYTCRVEFTKPDGSTGKDVIPVTWQVSTSTGESRWRQGAMDKPRPLYGAELLDAAPDANVVLVEGEKACDAARRLLADFPVLVLTWAGGCKAVDHADWADLAGRKIVGWPDCDSQADKRTGELRLYAEQPGMAAMLRIADLVAEHGAAMRVVRVPEPGHLVDGWDLFDAEAEGWDGARVMAYLREQLATPDEIRERGETKPASDATEPLSDATEGPNDEPPPPDDADPPPAKGKREKPAKRPPPSPEEAADQLPVRPLGYNHGRYYYLSTNQRQVHEYTAQAHGANGLMQLAPLAYWAQVFAYGDEMKSKHWQAATDALMRRCEREGIFDTSIIRGRGCWLDESRLVINLGNRLIVDGTETSVDGIDSTFIYEAGARMAGPTDKPLSVAEARRVLDIAKRFNWEMPASAALLAGWIVLAPLCGALPWRPHIWLTGGSGTGKTTILEQFIVPLLARTEVQVQGNSTEAGIRQALRADARPVVFDETEKNNEREEARIDNVLSLIRQSSSESQSRTLKGTTTGKQLEFHIRSMFCLSSVQVGLQRQADHTRIAVLSLFGKSQASNWEEMQDRWLETEQLLAELRDDPEYGRRLMARTIEMADVIRGNIRTLVRVAAKEFRSQRLGDQYGTLLAGAATLLYDHPITEEGALKFIRLFDWSSYHEAANEDESADALTAIMQIEVQVDVASGLSSKREVRTAGELVRVAFENVTRDGVDPGEANAALGRMGMKVKRGIVGKDAGLLLANKSEKLGKALRGNPWAADWRSYVRRLPGAKPHGVPITFSPGYSARATFVPIDVVLPRSEDPDLG
jgi:putative DNA primase/helicase